MARYEAGDVADPDSDLAEDLVRQITAVPGVAQVYPRSALRSAANLLRPPSALLFHNSRVAIEDGVVTVIIGTAEGSIAREVAHEVHNTVVDFLSSRALPLLRVDIEIATIGIGHGRQQYR